MQLKIIINKRKEEQGLKPLNLASYHKKWIVFSIERFLQEDTATMKR